MHSVKLYKDSIYESLSSAGQTKHGSFEVLTQKMRGGLSDLVKDLFAPIPDEIAATSIFE